jgi:hypothetical protein
LDVGSRSRTHEITRRTRTGYMLAALMAAFDQ